LIQAAAALDKGGTLSTYCFVCRNCGTRFTANTRAPEIPYCCDEPVLSRDYRGEGVGIAVAGLRAEREAGGSAAVRDLFLPTAAEEATPDDPDGSKAIRAWNETHEPKNGNKNPVRPEMPLHSKTVL
jgi:hypothetical protein